MAFLATVAVLAVATVTAVAAEDRGERPGVWFVLGAFLPVVALAFLLLAYDATPRPSPAQRSQDDALRHSVVARYLAAGDPAAAFEIAEAVALSEPEVLAQLRALQTLGFGEPTPGGRWRLTTQAQAALQTRAV